MKSLVLKLCTFRTSGIYTEVFPTDFFFLLNDRPSQFTGKKNNRIASLLKKKKSFKNILKAFFYLSETNNINFLKAAQRY